MENQEINNQLKKRRKRPIIMTVVCVLGFISSILTILMIFSEAAPKIGKWYPPYLLITGVIGFICMIGFWKMKKWAAYIYLVILIINQFILIAMGTWNMVGLGFSAVVVGVILSQVSKMD